MANLSIKVCEMESQISFKSASPEHFHKPKENNEANWNGGLGPATEKLPKGAMCLC